jgi:hypothetical protein
MSSDHLDRSTSLSSVGSSFGYFAGDDPAASASSIPIYTAGPCYDTLPTDMDVSRPEPVEMSVGGLKPGQADAGDDPVAWLDLDPDMVECLEASFGKS